LVPWPGGCRVNPVTGEKEFILVSPGQEKVMGRKAAEEVEKELGKSIKDQQLQNYINYVGQRIAAVSHTPQEGFSYKAIDHKSVNAFALPGGYIYITTGMLKQLNTEAQLAAILAHETAHVTARHSVSRISRNFLISLGMSLITGEKASTAIRVANIVRQLEGMAYSRKQERQADRIGLDYLVKAGYTPNGMIETMEMLEKRKSFMMIEFLSTHPSPENRVEYIRADIYNKHYSSEGRVGAEDYARCVLDRL